MRIVGLFGKSKKELLAWQKIVLYNSPDKLIMSEKQLKQISYQTAQNHIRIIQDCIRLIRNTTNPEVFFSRLELLKKHGKALAALEPYIAYSGASPTAALEEVILREQEAIYNFIVRYYENVFDKAAALKTEKAKKRQFQKFYDSLQNYYDRIDERSIRYIEYKYRQNCPTACK